MGDVMLGRVDVHLPGLFQHLSRHRVEGHDALHLIPKERNFVNFAVFIRRCNLKHIPSDPESAWLQFHIIALVLAFHQLAHEGIAAKDFANLQFDYYPVVFIGITKAVNARNRSDNDDIPP